MSGDSIDFDDEELEAASHWYSGQGSMLYAITSTGALSRGTQRPWNDDEDRPMTNDEWMEYLGGKLVAEAEECARDALKQSKKARGKEKEELLADHDALLSIAEKVRSSR